MSLNERFAESQGAPIELDGRLVDGIHRLPVRPPAPIEVTVLKHSIQRAQGLALRVKPGRLAINDVKSKAMDLGTDTMPGPIVSITLEAPADIVELTIWNLWRHQGQTWAFSRNAGMLVEPADDGVILRCSDGFGEVNFDDLVVQVRMTTPDEGPA